MRRKETYDFIANEENTFGLTEDGPISSNAQ